MAVNPEGQLPLFDDDGHLMARAKVINRYPEDVFPAIPLRPRDPVDAARRRYWTNFVDEQVLNYNANMACTAWWGVIARNMKPRQLEKLMMWIPLRDQRKKWNTVGSGFSEADLAYAIEKVVYAFNKVENSLCRPHCWRPMTTWLRTLTSMPSAA